MIGRCHLYSGSLTKEDSSGVPACSFRASVVCDTRHGLSRPDGHVPSSGLALLSLGEQTGSGGHRYTRAGPLAELVTRRMARRHSAIARFAYSKQRWMFMTCATRRTRLTVYDAF